MTSTAPPAHYQTQDEKFWEQAMEEKGSPTKERKEQFSELWNAVDIVAAANPSYYEPPTLKYERKIQSCKDSGIQKRDAGVPEKVVQAVHGHQIPEPPLQHHLPPESVQSFQSTQSPTLE